MTQSRRRTRYCITTLLALLALAVSLSACQAQEKATSSTQKKTPPKKGDTVMLSLIAYNYTDHYIDNYSVNGIGGANVDVSTPDAGGSKQTCCILWTIGTPLPVTVHVRWVSGECLYTAREAGQNFPRAKVFWSEQDVKLTKPPSADPNMFETHFYPDGHIEVAITNWFTAPRLKLPVTKNGLRPGAKPWPHCTAKQLKDGED